ncbi:Translocase of chloroplast [Asimina triloba]
MATPQLTRDWTGIQQFPTATQNKLLELLGKLKQENVSTLTILVMGKGGMGKSSTVNSILGERVATVSAFQSEALRALAFSRSRAGFTLNIIDTPGLVEGGYVNEHALDVIKRFLLNKTIDVLLYVDRLDAYRVDNLDSLVIRAITDSLGKAIWRRTAIVLTHAQLSPPDGLSYDEFFSKRSEALLKTVRSGSGLKNRELKESAIPVVLVENSGRCNTNESGEKILPNGIAWIPELVKTITNIISNGSKAIVVDKELIEGPNLNDRGKFWIPLIIAFQVEHRLISKASLFGFGPNSWQLRFSISIQGTRTDPYAVSELSVSLGILLEKSCGSGLRAAADKQRITTWVWAKFKVSTELGAF